MIPPAMPLRDTDEARLKVLLTALKRGKWELDGEEILAFGQMFAWASSLIERMEVARLVAEQANSKSVPTPQEPTILPTKKVRQRR